MAWLKPCPPNRMINPLKWEEAHRRKCVLPGGGWLGERLKIVEMGEAEGGIEILVEVGPVGFRDGEEYLDDARVELGAGAALDLFAGVGYGECAAVGAVGNHGVQGIGDGEYARADGDILAAEAAGVAGAVEELLVGEDDLGGVAEKGDASEHVVADLAVGAHDLLFLVVERAGLAEDAVGDGHLADIVEKGGAGKDGEIFKLDAHGLGDGDGGGGDALTVPLGFGVAEVEGAAEGFQGVVVGLF